IALCLLFDIFGSNLINVMSELLLHGKNVNRLTLSNMKFEGIKDAIFDRCRLEEIPVWNDEIRQRLKPDQNPLKECNRDFKPLTELDGNGRVNLINPESSANYECKARALIFKTEYRNAHGYWHKLPSDFVFENDIVEVECMHGREEYHYLHSQIWRNQKDKKNVSDDKSTLGEAKPSVYIYLVDSVSHAHAKRAFPQTLDFIKRKFDAEEMPFLNKVGDNSRPNGFAFLTGKVMTPIYHEIFGLPNIEADFNGRQYCDDYMNASSFVLKDFEKVGYKTMMTEDWNVGVFSYPDCYGFENLPATHYSRPFQTAYDTSEERFTETQGRKNCFLPFHFINEYLESFIRAYPGEPKASLTWAARLAHDDPNDAFHADTDLRNLFERHQEEFDNSFVFFMGDHGPRFGPLMRTSTANWETSNPMLMVSIPRRLRKSTAILGNLRRNSRELLTHFDVHATFIDIAETFSLPSSPNFDEAVRKPELKGSSLLRPLPASVRNCKTLPIPFPYCICRVDKVPVKIEPRHLEIVHLVTRAINALLKDAGSAHMCEVVNPKNDRPQDATWPAICPHVRPQDATGPTTSDSRVTSLERVVGTSGLLDAKVAVEPSGGVYQVYIREQNGSFFLVSPELRRLDTYGTQGACMPKNELKPLCYCKYKAYFGSILNLLNP
ncbi:hypothetical protein PFISCL1PPCAC_259, partial [Pristionchus fissidentatus]